MKNDSPLATGVILPVGFGTVNLILSGVRLRFTPGFMLPPTLRRLVEQFPTVSFAS